MGRNKLFMEISGESLLRRAVKTAIAGRLDPVIVVVGHEAERAAAAVSDLPCWIVLNPAYVRGINSSIRAGVLSVPADVEALLVVLADMPFVSAGMIAALVERYEETHARLIVSMYGEVTAPPMLYDRSLFAELAGRSGTPPPDAAPTADGCGKRVLNRHRAEAVFVPWPPGLETDLDVPEEYERVKALIEGERSCHAR